MTSTDDSRLICSTPVCSQLSLGTLSNRSKDEESDRDEGVNDEPQLDDDDEDEKKLTPDLPTKKNMSIRSEVISRK